METRLLTPADLGQAQQLWDYSFEKKATPFFQWYFSEYLQPQNIVGCFKQDKLLTMLCVNPYKISLNNQPVSTRYIVGVTTAPESRGLGTFSELLRYTFKQLLQEDIYLVLLKPIAAKLYSAYDFAFCYNQLKYSLLIEQLQFFKKDKTLELRLVEATACNIIDLQNIYNQAMQNLNAYVLRTKQDFLNLLKVHFLENGHLLLAYQDNKPVGYLMYQLTADTLTITELMSINNSVQTTFLNFVYQHRSQSKYCHWRTSINNLAYLDLDIKQEANFNFPQLAPFMMARIINVKSALSKLKYDNLITDIELTIQITDDFVEDNNAVFFIKTTKKNNLLVHKSSESVAQIKMRISTFTQLYLGAYSVDSLVLQGLIVLDSQATQQVLQDLFPLKTNYINEEF